MNANLKSDIVKEKLVNNYVKYYRIAFGYVKNEHDALDVVQEASYKAILKCSSIRNIEYTDTWICRIIINEAKTLLNKKRKKELDYVELQENYGFDNGNNVDRIDLMRALDMLNEQEKTLIILRFFEEYKLEEISYIMKLNLNTVKTKLYRTINKMEHILGKEV